MKVLQNSFTKGNFFLFPVRLQQVYEFISTLDHQALRNLSSLVVAVTIYKLWCERNVRLHSDSAKSWRLLCSEIKKAVAFKLKRWVLKIDWPIDVYTELQR